MVVLDAYLVCEERFRARMVLWDGSWIDARTLHKELKVGKDFTTWINGRINKYEFIENDYYKFCSPKRGSKGRGGHNITDYSLTLDMAKELSMVENNKIRKRNM